MSNHKNPGGVWPRIAALAAVAGIVLLASGCGGGSSSNPDASSTPGASSVAKEVAFANCMRAHGVSTSVDPGGGLSSGGSSSTGSGATPQTVLAAQNACKHLLPDGGKEIQAAQAQNLNRALKYSRCMRSHGVTDFPDPTTNGSGQVGFNGVNATVPGYSKANQACQPLMTGGGS